MNKDKELQQLRAELTAAKKEIKSLTGNWNDLKIK